MLPLLFQSELVSPKMGKKFWRFSNYAECFLFLLGNPQILSLETGERKQMYRKRNNLDITADILRVAEKGAKKTRIVYQANLNFKTLHEYLEKLESAGLLENSVDRGGLITTTEKGSEYLDHYEEFKKYVNPPSIDQPLISVNRARAGLNIESRNESQKIFHKFGVLNLR